MTSRVVLSATMESFERLNAFVEEAAAKAHLEGEKLGDLLLAVEEVFVNIVKHAYLGEPGKIEVSCSVLPRKRGLRLTFRDWGVPFDPLTQPEPDLSAPAEERPIGGLGIFLTTQVMDKVGYKRKGDTNRLTMVKKRTPATPRPRGISLRKMSTRLSLVLMVTTLAVTGVFAVYFSNQQARRLNETILEKGAVSARMGARISAAVLSGFIEEEILTEEEVFDLELKAIPFPKNVLADYEGIGEDILTAYRKFCYKTGLDTLLDRTIREVEDAFLLDPQFRYACLVDRNGYVPAHNSPHSHPLTGDFEVDINQSRSKRVFDDEVGIRAARNTDREALRQFYERDTDEKIWDISSPVFVSGRHWGAFRIGFVLDETYAAMGAARRRLLLLMFALALLIVLVLFVATELMMKPLGKLLVGVKQVAHGDLSHTIPARRDDEIGDLARAFNRMTADLRSHIEDLKNTTAAKERIEGELRVARDIQSSMLPRTFPPFPDRKEFDLFATLETAKEVGGDFYDFFLIDQDRLCFCIGDVAGKGVPASLFMAVTRTLIRAKTTRELTPAEILSGVNTDLCAQNESCMFVTLFCGILDFKTGELAYANGGHNPPLVRRGKGPYAYLEGKTGTALGVMQNVPLTDCRLTLEPGDSLVLYTDGVTEALDENGEEYGEERLARQVNGAAELEPIALINKTLESVKSFAGTAPQADDITLVGLRLNSRSVEDA